MTLGWVIAGTVGQLICLSLAVRMTLTWSFHRVVMVGVNNSGRVG